MVWQYVVPFTSARHLIKKYSIIIECVMCLAIPSLVLMRRYLVQQANKR
jgi:hypothetical protein